jgi:DNA invertase Pin-like site-specific DNA recombinase
MARWSERLATASVPRAADRYRTAAGKCFLDMLGVFAEFETNLRRERQLEGIAKAKAAGVYKGRPCNVRKEDETGRNEVGN